jgi:hypothetical protein
MTALTNTQKIEALQRAQDALRERGWQKYAFKCGENICASTALAVGQGLGTNWHYFREHWDVMFHSDLLQDVIQDMPMPKEPCMDAIARICLFNNEEAQTVDDVIAQFQITIDRLARQNHPASRERELVAV